MGTCGWTDESIGKCGRFYPGYVKSATQRLRHYSTHFPCVEVDTSNYAIPPAERIADWASQTPATFKFHFKIFSLFTLAAVTVSSIPAALRHLVTPDQVRHGKVRLQDTSDVFKAALWSYWNATLRPIHQAGKLGVTIFQFHLGFLPNKVHICMGRSGCRALA